MLKNRKFWACRKLKVSKQEQKMPKRKKSKKFSKIDSWKMLWKELEPGPRGALIFAFATFIWFLIPIIIKLALIILAALIGAAVGTFVGWMVRTWRKKRIGK